MVLGEGWGVEGTTQTVMWGVWSGSVGREDAAGNVIQEPVNAGQ